MPIEATPLLDQLLAGHVIDQPTYDAAKQKLTRAALPHEPFPTMGEGLFWLLENEIVSAEAIDEIEKLSLQEGAFSTNAIRKQAVAEFSDHLEARQAAHLKDFDRQFWAGVFPGPRWAWLTGGAAALVFAGWFFLAPDATPSCADANVQKTLRSALVESMYGDSSKLWMGAANERPNPLLAKFSNIKEIGYIKVERSRGCSATLTMGNMSLPMAFTVGPENGDSKIMVRGGDQRVIEAKYGRADKNGVVPEFGAPIGKQSLSSAFSNGVEAFEKKTAPLQASAFKEAERRRGVDTDRKTVQSAEPLADCVAVESDKKYTCRLQIQYIDRLMTVLGSSDVQVIQGDFDFVKQGRDWVVSDDFARQYTDAIVRGRVAALKGDEVASRLEDIQKNRGKAVPAPAN